MADLSPDDERAEELTTLQSIYPELTYDLHNPPTATIDVEISPTTPLSFLFVPYPNAGMMEYPPSKPRKIRLSHLPPLHVEVALPEGYPARCSPTVRLTSSWLSNETLKTLTQECHSLWEEYCGMQVLFTYFSYLQEAAEDGFGLTKEAPMTLSRDQEIDFFAYDKKKKLELFNNGTFDCGVCLEPKNGSSCYQIQRCNHVFCKACLQAYYISCISEGDVDNVRCMDPGCGKTGDVTTDRRKKDPLISPLELLEIPLPLDITTRYAQLKRKKKMEADKTIVWCPRKWCQGAMRSDKYPKIQDVRIMDWSSFMYDDTPVEHQDAVRKKGDNTDRLAICEECNLAFCKQCLASWHGEHIACKVRHPSELSEEDQASLDFIRANTTPCPTCTVPCQKEFGCNHMTCFQCKSHFCYLCSAWLDSGNPYQHFNDPKKKGCYQRLMDGVDGEMQGQFGGARGAAQVAEFWEAEALRIQMEEME